VRVATPRSQDGCELDVPVGESIGGGGVGDELWQVEVNLREVLRHLWLQLLSKRTDAEKLSRLEAMLTKLMQRLQDFRVMLQVWNMLDLACVCGVLVLVLAEVNY
jgi:hypothetical protein